MEVNMNISNLVLKAYNLTRANKKCQKITKITRLAEDRFQVANYLNYRDTPINTVECGTLDLLFVLPDFKAAQMVQALKLRDNDFFHIINNF